MNDQMNELTTAIGQNELIQCAADEAWQRAAAVWLSGKRPHTRRAYGRIVGDFFQFVNVPPAEVTGDMVNAWKLHLQSLGRRDTTIAQRLAGLSSFFAHLQRKAGLIDRNPVDMVERGDLEDSPYGNAKPMTKANFQAIMSELDPTTAAGAMYRALFMAYALTGKRRSELLRLHGRDLSIDGDKVTYHVTTKGGKGQRRTMPPAVWSAIRHYLTVAGRAAPPADDEPLFIATHATGNYVNSHGRYIQRASGEPLSGTAATDALKRAAERAGVDPRRVTIHGMRHLAAAMWKAAHGNDIRGLQSFLGHANVATTQIYDETVFSDEHTDYDAMAEALFMGHAMAT
jgi:integrase/recombinase XerD